MPRKEDEDNEEDEARDAQEHENDAEQQEDACEWSGEERWDAREDERGDEPISHWEAEEQAEERAEEEDARSHASGRSSDTESWRRRRSPSTGRDHRREDDDRAPRRIPSTGTLKATVSRVAGASKPLAARVRRSSLGGPPVGSGPVGAPVGARPLGRLSAQVAASARRLQQQAPWNGKGLGKGKSSKVGKSTAAVGDRLGRFARGVRVLGEGDKGDRLTSKGKGGKGDRPMSKGKGDKGDRPMSIGKGSKGDRLGGKGGSQGKTKGASYPPLRAPAAKGSKGASWRPVGGGGPVGGGASSGPLAALRLKVGLRGRGTAVGASRTISSVRTLKFDKGTLGGRVFSESTRRIPLRPKPPWGKGATGGASGSSAEPQGSSGGASSSHRHAKGNGSSSGSTSGVREEAAQVISTATAALEKLLKVAGSGKLSSSGGAIGSGSCGSSSGGGGVGSGAIGSNAAGPPPRGSTSGGDGRGSGFRRITLQDNERRDSTLRRRDNREASRSCRRQEDRGRRRLRSRSPPPTGKQRWTQSPDNALPPIGRRAGKSPEGSGRRDGRGRSKSRRGQRDSPQRFSDRRDPPARRPSRSRSHSRPPVRRRRD
eukprot:TRINITY_DN25742_c0_g1_i2.p1 TRINITY_DN25742_c0_g1~~TRINITY_DN25742_c0_g1_i2.p1  ORF type:complete len:599 (+),score=104.08 TRINITY_DN25742_c0_g1_i2:116-1912(+)